MDHNPPIWTICIQSIMYWLKTLCKQGIWILELLAMYLHVHIALHVRTSWYCGLALNNIMVVVRWQCMVLFLQTKFSLSLTVWSTMILVFWGRLSLMPCAFGGPELESFASRGAVLLRILMIKAPPWVTISSEPSSRPNWPNFKPTTISCTFKVHAWICYTLL